MSYQRVGIHIDEIEPRFSAPPTALRGQTGACSVCGVDSLGLFAGDDLLKRRSVARFERKYFAGQSLIKISDNIHPSPLLRDAEICAVKHAPFKTIPQFMNRFEDSSEGLPAVVVEKPRHVLKKKIFRVPGFSHSHDFMKERTSCVVKSESPSGDGEWLTRKAAADEIDFGQFVCVDFCCVATIVFTSCIV